MKINNKAFTLVELLVVILIIGILAAIAVPQYQKAILKARLHQGVSLVESLYQAQQAYYLQHGDFATDIDDLDVSIPKDESCEKTQNSSQSFYTCDYGKIGFWDGPTNAQYQAPDYKIAYLHFFKERYNTSSLVNSFTFEAGKRYCYGRIASKTAQEICVSMGGVYQTEAKNETGWKLYLLD